MTQHPNPPLGGDEAKAVAWLRDAHSGEGDECLVPAAKGDPGAFPVYAAPVLPVEVREKIADAVLDACRQYADMARAYVGKRRDVHTGYILSEATDAVLSTIKGDA